MAVSIIVPMLLLIVYAVYGYDDAKADARDRMARRVAVLAEHAGRVFDTATLAMDAVEARISSAGEGREELSGVITAYATRSPAISGMLLIDPLGRIRASNLPAIVGMDVAQREYFTRGLTHSGRPVISAPIVAQKTGERLFTLSRRMASGGVLAVSVLCSYFERVFQTLAGPDEMRGVVTLYRDDGRQLVRVPAVATPIDLSADNPGLMRHLDEASGFYSMIPTSSAHERIYAFHKVPGYPVFATYGVDLPEVLTSWRRDALVASLLAVTSSLLLAGLVMRESRQSALKDLDRAALRRAVAQRTDEALAAVEARERAVRGAENAQNAKSQFLAAASHDLRQPIQALRLFVDLLDSRLRDPGDRRILDHASNALRGAEDLLGALLDISTLDAGMVRAALVEVDLGALLSGLAVEFGSRAAVQGVSFRAIPCSGRVLTDPVLLVRMLRNLLENGLRFTRGRLVLGCRHTGDWVRIEIIDDGPGIPEDKHDAVFEDFVQLGNPERDRAKGLGLGLAVVRRMSLLLDHPVGMRSVPGKGTAFWITVRKA